MKQIVKFVIDKDLDIKNHLIALGAYKRNIKRGFSKQIDQKKEDLLKLSLAKRKKTIGGNLDLIYRKKEQLKSIAQDINKEWSKIERDFIKKLEKIHKNKFPYSSIKGVLSSADKFGYDTGEWFATDMFRNKYIAIDVATHELMHFMFHKYFEDKCKKEELSENKIWDIKESFTVLLNLEFDKFRFRPDLGREPHKELRSVIEKAWIKTKDFDKTLDSAIEFVKIPSKVK